MSKQRMNALDMRAAVFEANARLSGMRVSNVYDMDSKTYLLKLQGSGSEKAVLLFKSGQVFYITSYDWPKASFPSNFATKLRKHLRGLRLTSIVQLGSDRVIDMSFGFAERVYHIVIELYDRGNVILTDKDYVILALLRTRTAAGDDGDGGETRFAVREVFPVHEFIIPTKSTSEAMLRNFLLAAAKEPKMQFRKLRGLGALGPHVLQNCLLEEGLSGTLAIRDIVEQPLTRRDTDVEGGHEVKATVKQELLERLVRVVHTAENLLKRASLGEGVGGFIIQKAEKRARMAEASSDNSAANREDDIDGTTEEKDILLYTEYHPFLFRQHVDGPYENCQSFCMAVDRYYHSIMEQKLDLAQLQKERDVMKKLTNLQNESTRRVEALVDTQAMGQRKAELIMQNLDAVDQALLVVRSAVAAGTDWTEVSELVEEARMRGDPVAGLIVNLNLMKNQMSLKLTELYNDSDLSSSSSLFSASSDSEKSDDYTDFEKKEDKRKKIASKTAEQHAPQIVVVDIALSAYANSQKYYDTRRAAAVKEDKTMKASKKALASMEKQTRNALKAVETKTAINRVRKPFWFEKFYWFITSENYLVIGGRDRQQNELVVKRHLRQGDIYVHADLHGASSVIIKNPLGTDVPPKTLSEAGAMAICYSAAWAAKIVTSAWWVFASQVSKTAPTGEYLTTGSFMIRGKKNFLPPAPLVMGLGFLFQLGDDSLASHIGERKVRQLDDIGDDIEGLASPSIASENVEISLTACSSKDRKEENPELERNEIYPIEKSSISPVSMDATLTTTIPVESPVCVEDSSSDNDEAFPDTHIGISIVPGTDKYELHVEGATQAANDVPDGDNVDASVYLGDDDVYRPPQKGTSSTKKRLTAKERRQQQRNKSDGSTREKQEPCPSPLTFSNIKKAPVDLNKSTPQPSNSSPLPRGKRSKAAKKKLEKYADQDEEERRIRMELLASTGSGADSKASIKKGKAAAVASVVASKVAEAKKRQEKAAAKRRVDASASEVLDTIHMDDDDAAANVILHSADSPPPHDDDDLIENNAAEEAEIRALLKKENALDEETADQLTALDSLTGVPLPDDTLLFAVPVCAPLSSLVSYKYKVKLLPGSTKKGKASKTATTLFLSSSEITQREREVMRATPDHELVNGMPGKLVSVSALGIQKQRYKGKGNGGSGRRRG